MDEETEATQLASVGEQLRAAREEKGFSLDDIAAETRIPLRHLESLETSDWDSLPAPTYTLGFAKSYASAVGLDRTEIGEQLRSEMGGFRSEKSTVETFEPADPARTMPRWLVVSAIIAIVVAVLVFTWIRNRSLTEEPAPDIPVATQVEPAQSAPAVQQAKTASPQGPVVITAEAPAWIRVTDQGNTLFEGMMQKGQTFQVPETATAPMLRAGAPEALRISVGQSVAPPVGPAGEVASNVSLLPSDLMKAPQSSSGEAASSAEAQNSLAQ